MSGIGQRSGEARGSDGTPDRRGEHSHRHLADVAGTRQAGAYAGFNLHDSGRIREAVCWPMSAKVFRVLSVRLRRQVHREFSSGYGESSDARSCVVDARARLTCGKSEHRLPRCVSIHVEDLLLRCLRSYWRSSATFSFKYFSN